MTGGFPFGTPTPTPRPVFYLALMMAKATGLFEHKPAPLDKLSDQVVEDDDALVLLAATQVGDPHRDGGDALPVDQPRADGLSAALERVEFALVGGRRKNGNGCGTPLGVAVRQWPTPTVCGNYNVAGASPASGDGLATAVQGRALWATATARDSRSGKASPETHARNARPLSEQVGDLLNPDWVELLMGFPPGHTAGVPAVAKPRSPRSPRARRGASGEMEPPSE